MEIFAIVCLAIIIIAIPFGVVWFWKNMVDEDYTVIIGIIVSTFAILIESWLFNTISIWICQLN